MSTDSAPQEAKPGEKDDTGPRCKRCGGSLRERATGSFCPSCLGRLAFGDLPEAPPDMPESLEQLRRFGDYELLGEIARGGMGVVYRARQVRLDREVAVKLMLHGLLASAEDVERFRAEATAAASLQHPGIVAIHEVGEQEGQHYFSMELIRGRSLEALTRSGPLEPDRAARLLRQVAEAVAYAHGRGVVHRDIKPSNILVDEGDQVHVTDFGLAKRLQRASTLTLAGQVLGTPGFMAPELAKGTGGQEPTVDIYSLGALLYHMLTARPPFVGKDLLELLRRIG